MESIPLFLRYDNGDAQSEGAKASEQSRSRLVSIPYGLFFGNKNLLFAPQLANPRMTSLGFLMYKANKMPMWFPTRLNSHLKAFKFRPARWAKIDKTLSIRFIKVIIRLFTKLTPHFNNSDDLTQCLFAFGTF